MSPLVRLWRLLGPPWRHRKARRLARQVGIPYEKAKAMVSYYEGGE